MAKKKQGGASASGQPERAALFRHFKPKKPVEAGLKTHRFLIHKPASQGKGFASFDCNEAEEADRAPSGAEQNILMENLATLMEGYGGAMVAERKLDGYNLSLKVTERGEVAATTSRGNPYPLELFPELHLALERLAGLGEGVYIGEMHGIAPEGCETFTNIEAFAGIRTRMAASGEDEALSLMGTCPVQLSLYDAYLSQEKMLLDVPMEGRREALEELLAAHDLPGIGLAPSHSFTAPEDVYALYLAEISSGEEGLVLKNPLAPVKWSLRSDGTLSLPRTWDFVKLKKDLVLDLIVLGYMTGESERTSSLAFTNLLCGVLNEETGLIETLTKTMGITSENSQGYAEMSAVFSSLGERGLLAPGYEMGGKKRIALPQPGVAYSPRMKPDTFPDVAIVNPLENAPIVRVKAMQVSRTYGTPDGSGKEGGEHSCGRTTLTEEGMCEIYSLRHPVLLGLHDEKQDVREAETTEKIRSLA